MGVCIVHNDPVGIPQSRSCRNRPTQAMRPCSRMPFGLALQGLIDAQPPKHGALEICAVRHDLQGAAAAEARVRARLQKYTFPCGSTRKSNRLYARCFSALCASFA